MGRRSLVKGHERLLLLIPAVVALSAASLYSSQASTQMSSSSGDAVRGKAYYENACAGCHSVDQNRIGPRHRDVVGRRIASVAGFEYSDALRELKGTWNGTLLNEWLIDPQAVAPGTTMGFRVDDAGNRADVIAYLKTISKRRSKR
jgi:cytochrome c